MMQGLTPFEQIAIWSVLGVAILGLAYAWFLRSQIMREDKGTEKMQEVWGAIRDGADAYLGQQLKSILPLIGILTIALFFSVYIVPPSPEAQQRFPGMGDDQLRLWIGLARAVAFVMGAGFSLTVGQIGMRMAVQGNVRVASASRRSFADALRIAYRTGTITGMLTDGLGLFGGTIIFIILGIAAPDALLGFGFGGTLLALSIALASWRMVRTQLLLPWVGYLGLILAALLLITAIQFSADTMQVETTLSPFSFATLALWLICIGVLLSSLRALPEEGAPGGDEAVSEATDTSDSADNAQNPQ